MVSSPLCPDEDRSTLVERWRHCLGSLRSHSAKCVIQQLLPERQNLCGVQERYQMYVHVQSVTTRLSLKVFALAVRPVFVLAIRVVFVLAIRVVFVLAIRPVFVRTTRLVFARAIRLVFALAKMIIIKSIATCQLGPI